MKPILALAMLGLLPAFVTAGGPGPSGGGGAAEKPLDAAGPMSNVRQPRRAVARNAKAFAALWKEHAPPGAPPPAVDFRRYDVVAVFAGMQRSGGYRVVIDGVRRSGRAATVEATLWKPGPHSVVPMIITYPFAMRAMPKLPPTVTFVVAEKTRQRPGG